MSRIEHHPRRGETGEETRASRAWLSAGYTLDESDPEILILRRTDGSFSAAFSVAGATREGILSAAEEDRRRDYPDDRERIRHGSCSRDGTDVVVERGR